MRPLQNCWEPPALENRMFKSHFSAKMWKIHCVWKRRCVRTERGVSRFLLAFLTFPRVCYLLTLTIVSPQVLQIQNHHLSRKVCTAKSCCELPNKNLQKPTGWNMDTLNITDELSPPSKAKNLPELMELKAHTCMCFLPSRKKTSSAHSPFRPTLSNTKASRTVPRWQETSLCNGCDIWKSLCRRWSRHEIIRSVNPLPIKHLTFSACVQQTWRFLFSSGNKIWTQEERKYLVLPQGLW